MVKCIFANGSYVCWQYYFFKICTFRKRILWYERLLRYRNLLQCRWNNIGVSAYIHTRSFGTCEYISKMITAIYLRAYKWYRYLGYTCFAGECSTTNTFYCFRYRCFCYVCNIIKRTVSNRCNRDSAYIGRDHHLGLRSDISTNGTMSFTAINKICWLVFLSPPSIYIYIIRRHLIINTCFAQIGIGKPTAKSISISLWCWKRYD